MDLYFWTFALVFLFNQLQCSVTDDCSEANIQNNLQRCLTGIWNKATDKSAFFYGTNWKTICGFSSFQAPFCGGLGDFNTYSPHSLLNTVYGLNWDLSQNPLKQFLHVTYQSETGSYVGCGNTYTVTEAKNIKLEPLLSKNYHPWDTRKMPSITWTPSANTLYTLIIYDTGSYISHGIFGNINGTDIGNSEVLKTYSGPKNPSIKEQPYAFLLFEQTGGRLNVTDEWRQKLANPMVKEAYNFTDVFQELQLNGPIAINWVQVVQDPYSVQYFVDNRILNNCPNMVTKALKSKSISFIPDNVDLSMSLDIQLRSTAVNFESCCKSYNYQDHTATLNPIGDGYISPGRARTGSDVKMSLLREGYLYIPSFQNPVHTLLLLDISVANPTAATPDLPLLHMMVTNIAKGNLTSGDVIRSYRGPAPPDYLNHTYIFLLYQQNAALSVNDTLKYLTNGCNPGIDGRCLFNVTRFTNGNGLQLVGASWFLATTDEYVRYSHIAGGQNANDVCKNIQGYGNPCPVGTDDCSEVNIQNNLQQCLSGIWNKAKDKSAFWYGTQWSTICGFSPFQAPYCASLGDFNTYSPHSLLNTVYGLNWDLSQNPLKQFLHVTYQSETGSYVGCGNTYTVIEAKTIKLEPLLSKIYHPWDTRKMPTITWTPSANTMYTLIIFDTGAYVSHGIFINIIGTDIGNSEVLYTYRGPGNSSIRKQPYVFLLFKQTGRLNVTHEWRQKLSNQMVKEAYNFTDVFRELQLHGPIAMNWIQVIKDPYSVQLFLDLGIINNCPNMVTEALKSKNISFIPDNVDLSMSLDMELQSTAVSFESCCKSYEYPEHTAKLNPIGDGSISPGRARTGSDVKMSLLREGILLIPSFQSHVHTLMLVDISVANPTAGTPDLPLLHMLVTNIAEGNLTSGDVIRSYRGPAPPDYLHHTYLFLLYKQNAALSVNNTLGYLTNGCNPGIDGRCLFNMTRFTDGNGLQLVGASWFLATTDEYVRHSHITGGQNEDDVCKNIQGYGNPCPVGEGHMTQASCIFIIIFVFLQRYLSD